MGTKLKNESYYYLYNTRTKQSYVKKYLIDVLEMIRISEDYFRHIKNKEEQPLENEKTKQIKEWEVTIYIK